MRLTQNQQQTLTDMLYCKFQQDRQETINRLTAEYQAKRDEFLEISKSRIPDPIKKKIKRSQEISKQLKALYKEQSIIEAELRSSGINPSTLVPENETAWTMFPDSIKAMSAEITRIKSHDDSIQKASKVVMSLILSDNSKAMDILAQHGIDLEVKPATAIEKKATK